jgi:hypothetical protein
MGPECLNSLQEFIDKRSDQYSLAITYFELRTNRRPYLPLNGPSDSMFYELERWPDISLLEEAECNVVLKALARNPEHRFINCLAFVRALEDAVMREPSLEHLPPQKILRQQRRHRKPRIDRVRRRRLLEAGNAVAVLIALYLVGNLKAVREHILIARAYQPLYFPALAILTFGVLKLLAFGWKHFRLKGNLKSRLLLPWIAVAIFLLVCIVVPAFIALWRF